MGVKASFIQCFAHIFSFILQLTVCVGGQGSVDHWGEQGSCVLFQSRKLQNEQQAIFRTLGMLFSAFSAPPPPGLLCSPGSSQLGHIVLLAYRVKTHQFRGAVVLFGWYALLILLINNLNLTNHFLVTMLLPVLFHFYT